MGNILIMGDLAFNGLISEEPQNNELRFKNVVSLIESDDIVFANLETPVEGSIERNQYKNFHRYADYDVTKNLISNLKINCVSLANNHIYDCKMPGLKSTIELLDGLNVSHTGAGWKKEHVEPVIFERNNLKIGFMAYVDKSTNPETDKFPELFINYLDVDKIKKDIELIINKVDLIICSLHWGTDYSNYYTKYQKNIGTILLDSGVNIIMGHHSHTLQPFELYKSKYIFYGLGQICFGDFIYHGRRASLKRKAKKGYIVRFNKNGEMINLVTTKETKGNYIFKDNNRINNRLTYKRMINRLILKNRLVKLLVFTKEIYFDRIIEFFFGYYRTPFKQLLNYNNYKSYYRIWVRDTSKYNKS